MLAEPVISSRTFRTAIKHWILAVLYFSGIMWAIAAARLRRRVVVLTYHRVLPIELQARSHSAPAIVVQPKTFDWHMRFVRRHLKPLTLRQFVEHLRLGRPPPPRSCLVTFDDGWHDTLEHALPVLRRHGVPAVLFVATDYIGTGNCFWQERLSEALQRAAARPDARSLLAGLPIHVEGTDRDLPRKEDIRALVEWFKSRPFAEVETLIGRLEGVDAAAGPAEQDRFLDWAELTTLMRSGLVSVGSHAMTHCPLTRLPPAQVSTELRESRRLLMCKLDAEVTAIAYPDGDANSGVAAMARSEGFEVGFTTKRGLVASGDDRFLLSRVNMHEGASGTRPAFLARLVGFI